MGLFGSVGKKSGGTATKSPFALLSELETLAKATGAREPEQDSPGLFRRAVDILSRPNYAVAGAVEEAFTERGAQTPEGPFGRAFRELFSGIGGLKGDKEGFAQVMEQSGVGELGKLSDIAPFLYSDTGEGWKFERGGVLDPTGRGAIGLAGDIFLDPTTYLGVGAAGKFAGRAGVKGLTKEGVSEWAKVQAKYAPKLADTMKITDDLARAKAQREIVQASKDEFEAAIRPDWIDKGGLKWFGQTVVPADTVRKLGTETVDALSKLPGGDRTIRAAAAGWDKSRATLNAVFSAFPSLDKLPPEMRDAAKMFHRNFVDTKKSTAGTLFAKWEPLKRRWDAMLKADPDLGKKFYDIREGTAQHALTPEQQALYDEVVDLYGRMEKHALDTGVLDPDDLLGGYFHHSYLNDPEEFAAVVANAGRPMNAPKTTAKFQRERPFKTYDEAVRKSRDMAKYGRDARAAGVPSTIYPELRPNYDVMDNLASYIDQFSDAVARKQWSEDIVRTWGVDLDPVLAKAVYEVATPIPVKPKERWMIDKVFDGFKSLRQMGEDLGMRETKRTAATSEFRLASKNYQKVAESAPLEYVSRERLKNLDEVRYYRRRGWDIVEEGDGKYVAYKLNETTGAQQQSWRKALANARKDLEIARKKAARYDVFERSTGGLDRLERVGHKMLPRMSDDGKREFFREMFTRVNSPSQYTEVADRFRAYERFFPAQKAVTPGTVDPHWAHLGDKAAYVPVSGGLYGDRTLMLPKHIVDDFEGLSSKLYQIPEAMQSARSLLRGYDKANNAFKIGVYTFWPASAVRDIYNNMAQAFLDIGIGAFARPMTSAQVLRGTGKVTLNGIEYDAKLLKEMAQNLGVTDKSGRTFAQLMDDKTYKPASKIDKAVAARASVENWTRVQLWLNNIHRGMDPRDAADKVREFLFDYGELNPIERAYFRRVIPFYTFPRKAIALHVKALGRTPGRLANELKPFRGREDENGMMTMWDGQAFKLRLDKDGKTVGMLTGIDLPIKTLDTLWRGDLSRTASGAMGMVSPLIKAVPEYALGRRFFDAKPLDRAQSAVIGKSIEALNPPKAIKDWLGYSKRYDAAGRPIYEVDGRKYYIALQSWAFSRVASTTERQFKQYADDSNWVTVFVDLLSGLRYREFDMDEQMRRKYEERIRQLEQSLVERGAMKRYERTFTPKRAPELQ